ncbi:MAG: hypothetical protein ACOH5I_06700 [Oligoflexus sp.]
MLRRKGGFTLICWICLFINIKACSGDSFQDAKVSVSSGESKLSASDDVSLDGEEKSPRPELVENAAVASKEDGNDESEVLASEPVMVAGGFLACFIDSDISANSYPQSESNNGQSMGCAIYADKRYQRRLETAGVMVQNATLHVGNIDTSLNLYPQNGHPRWDWLGKLPVGGSMYELTIVFTDPLSPIGTTTVKVSVQASMNMAITFMAVNPNQDYTILEVESQLCLGGDPQWSIVRSAITGDILSLTSHPTELVACDDAKAVSFRFLPEEDGYIIHTANPAPAECLVPLETGLCTRSAIDLRDFGTGNAFELFAISGSVEAQRIFVDINQDGSISLFANDRYMMFNAEQLAVVASNPVQEAARLTLVRKLD